MYGCCKNDKVRSSCGPVLTLTHCIYCIVNGQDHQIKNQFVQLVLCITRRRSIVLFYVQAAGHYEASYDLVGAGKNISCIGFSTHSALCEI